MAYRSSSSGIGNSTGPSATVPAGVALNDIVIACCNYDSNAFTITWNNGFTAFPGRLDTLSLDGHRQSYAWKRATASEGASYGATLSSAIDWTIGYIALSGRDTASDPAISTASTNNSANSSPITVTANGVTASANDDLVWCAGLDVNASGIGNGFTAPSGYVERVDREQAWANLAMATIEAVGAGATGSVAGSAALTSGAAGWAAALIRVPVAGGGGGAVLRKNSLLRLGVGR